MDLERRVLALLLLLAPLPTCTQKTPPGGYDRTYTRAARKREFKGVASSAQRFGFANANHHSTHNMGASSGMGEQLRFSYAVPEGWLEVPRQEFRAVNLLVAGHRDAQCYLSILNMRSSVVSNVNRWRRQLGLPGIPASEVAALPKKTFFGRLTTYVELRGSLGGDPAAPSKDMIAGFILPRDGQLVTLKMVGPAAVLEAEVEKLQKLAAELAVGASSGSADKSKYSWQKPASWQPSSGHQMRLTSFKFGKSGKSECYLSEATGSLAENVNRWRAQFSLAPLGSAKLALLPTLEVMGRTAHIIEHRGSFKQIADAGMLGLVCEFPRSSLFVKMTGPADEVFAERENFLSFCRSLQRN